MKRLFIAVLVFGGCLYSGTVLAVSQLSDAELAGVSGGGIDSHLAGQGLSQEQQEPEHNNGDAPRRQPLSSNGMELTPEFFAVLQSDIKVDRQRKLLLDGVAQQNAVALNLDNAMSSDAVSVNNIFNGDSITLEDVTSNIEINQVNSINQLHRTQGSLTSSSADHKYEKSELRLSGEQSYEYHEYSFVDQVSTEEYLSTNGRRNEVAVGKTYINPTLKKLQDEGFIPSSFVRNGLSLLKYKVFELNDGTGFEIKGDVSPSAPIATAGSFTLDAEAVIDVKILWWTLHLELDLISIDNELTLNIETTPGDPGHQIVETETDTSLVKKQQAIDVAESTYSLSYEHAVFTGGEMAGAEAELLALSEGRLSVDSSSNVVLSDSAQKNMQVGNGINSVSSVAANALNLSRQPIFRGGSSILRSSTIQQNLFKQQL